MDQKVCNKKLLHLSEVLSNIERDSMRMLCVGYLRKLLVSRQYGVGYTMTEEFERILKEAAMALSRQYPGICLERLRKLTKTSGQSVLRPRFERSTSRI
jgi:hypothetical protein